MSCGNHFGDYPARNRHFERKNGPTPEDIAEGVRLFQAELDRDAPRIAEALGVTAKGAVKMTDFALTQDKLDDLLEALDIAAVDLRYRATELRGDYEEEDCEAMLTKAERFDELWQAIQRETGRA